jgi:uncharacterized protein (DUF2384 family)
MCCQILCWMLDSCGFSWFESAPAATSWLKRPNRALEGCAPIDLLDTDAGTEQVAELLDPIAIAFTKGLSL